MREFDLMLSFIKGDDRFKNRLGYVLSIGTKLKIIDLFYRHIIDQIPKVNGVYKEIKEKGYSEGKMSLQLLAYYEAYLNSIYSFLENISRITILFYPQNNLPHDFSSQRNRLVENPEIEPEYSKFLKNLKWYDEVHGIRSESTHFLSGLITSNQDILGYWNEPQSKRKAVPSKIDITSIEDHVKSIQQKVIEFIDFYGKFFIKKIDQEKEVIQICLIKNGFIGARWISLNQLLKGHPGRCHTIDFDCPKASKCKARKIALELRDKKE